MWERTWRGTRGFRHLTSKKIRCGLLGVSGWIFRVGDRGFDIIQRNHSLILLKIPSLLRRFNWFTKWQRCRTARWRGLKTKHWLKSANFVLVLIKVKWNLQLLVVWSTLERQSKWMLSGLERLLGSSDCCPTDSRKFVHMRSEEGWLSKPNISGFPSWNSLPNSSAASFIRTSEMIGLSNSNVSFVSLLREPVQESEGTGEGTGEVSLLRGLLRCRSWVVLGDAKALGVFEIEGDWTEEREEDADVLRALLVLFYVPLALLEPLPWAGSGYLHSAPLDKHRLQPSFWPVHLSYTRRKMLASWQKNTTSFIHNIRRVFRIELTRTRTVTVTVTVTNLSRTAISACHYVIRLLDKRAVLVIAQGSKHSANFHSVTLSFQRLSNPLTLWKMIFVSNDFCPLSMNLFCYRGGRIDKQMTSNL